MTLPLATETTPYLVYYNNGDFYYSDGTLWHSIVTAGSFTQVAANGHANSLDLGTWMGMIHDSKVHIELLQKQISNLSTQVITLQGTVNNLNKRIR